MDFIQCILLSLNFYFYPGLSVVARKHLSSGPRRSRGGCARCRQPWRCSPAPRAAAAFSGSSSRTRLPTAAPNRNTIQQSKTRFSRALDSNGGAGRTKIRQIVGTHQEVLALAGARGRGAPREDPLLVPLLIPHPHLARRSSSSSLPTVPARYCGTPPLRKEPEIDNQRNAKGTSRRVE